MTVCRSFYYSVAREAKIKANSVSAMKCSGGRYFFVESNKYNFMKEISAHCGWCAKTDAIIKYNLPSKSRKIDLRFGRG